MGRETTRGAWVWVSASCPAGDRGLELFWNGRRVSFGTEPGEPEEIAFRLDRAACRPDGEQHLAVVCRPYVPREAGLSDPRALGLAFRRIRFVSE